MAHWKCEVLHKCKVPLSRTSTITSTCGAAHAGGLQGWLQTNWMSMFTLRFHWEDVQAAKGKLKVLSSLFTQAGAISNTVQVQHGCRAMQESSIPQRGIALLLTAQGRDCSLLQWPYLKSVTSLNHTSQHPARTTGVFLWALHWTTTTPVSHQAESICTGEAQQQELSKPLHHPARAHSRRQANNIQLLQSVT